MPSMNSRSLYFSPCRAWTFRVSPSLSLFQKMSVWYNRETILMSMKQFFLMSLLPLFQLMNLYAMFSCPCNIKRFITINFISYTTLNYVRAWRNIFHAVTKNFKIYLENLVSKPLLWTKSVYHVMFTILLSGFPLLVDTKDERWLFTLNIHGGPWNKRYTFSTTAHYLVYFDNLTRKFH